jgi:hypothetical protein
MYHTAGRSSKGYFQRCEAQSATDRAKEKQYGENSERKEFQPLSPNSFLAISWGLALTLSPNHPGGGESPAAALECANYEKAANGTSSQHF